MFLSGALAGVVDAVAPAWVAALFLPVGPASFVLAFVWMYRPPWWLKPQWLLAEERGEAPPPAGRAARKPYLEVSPLEYSLLAAGVAALVAAWFVFELTPALLIAAGMGLSLLAAARMKRKNER